MEGLEAAISSHCEALIVSPIGHPHRSDSLYKLANSLYTRFEQSGRIEDLEEPSRVKHSLSVLLATQVVLIPSITLPLAFRLALKSWAGWRIWKK